MANTVNCPICNKVLVPKSMEEWQAELKATELRRCNLSDCHFNLCIIKLKCECGTTSIFGYKINAEGYSATRGESDEKTCICKE